MTKTTDRPRIARTRNSAHSGRFHWTNDRERTFCGREVWSTISNPEPGNRRMCRRCEKKYAEQEAPCPK